MTVLAQRSCPTCDRPVTVTRRNPNRRFCSPRCRAAHHRALATSNSPANDVANVVPGTTHAANDVTDDVPTRPNGAEAVLDGGVTNAVPNVGPQAVASEHAVPAANGVQRCPHCRAELAVITVVVPAGAAHIRTPEVTHMSPT